MLRDLAFFAIGSLSTLAVLWLISRHLERQIERISEKIVSQQETRPMHYSKDRGSY